VSEGGKTARISPSSIDTEVMVAICWLLSVLESNAPQVEKIDYVKPRSFLIHTFNYFLHLCYQYLGDESTIAIREGDCFVYRKSPFSNLISDPDEFTALVGFLTHGH
jgi:hypothetical protein